MTQSMPYQHMSESLLVWYDKEGRSLPWRDTRDPYSIWVSEIMLQQTQVKTVIPYYHRWLQAFPTLSDLAAAPQDRVLKLWEGLGYYSRARNLHRAAQTLADNHDGQFPATLAETLALPGIGRTTAGGILSSAFNQSTPILDGNVKRVLARLTNLDRPPAKALPKLWELSEALLHPTNPRDYNQALLDLGATICRPRQPECHRCPWQSHCAAFATDRQHLLPMKTPKAPRPHKQIAIAIVLKDDHVLIDRRPDSGMLAGMWEFPGGKIEDGETPEACAVREVKEEVGLEVEAIASLGTVEHAYTHFSVTLHTFVCKYISGEPQTLEVAEVRWVTPDQFDEFAFPVANQKIFPLFSNWLQEYLKNRKAS